MKFVFLLLLSTIGYSAPCHQIKIAVIDSGLNLNDQRFTHLCKSGHKNFVEGETMEDFVSHGTHVSGLIQKYARNSNYCMLIYKYYSKHESGEDNQRNLILSMREAVKNKADVINYSGGGPGFNEEEALVIKDNPQTIFVVAAGNEGHNLDIPGNEYYPASLFYKNMRVVENAASNGMLSPSSNYSRYTTYSEIGEDVFSYLPNGKIGYLSGSSQSTAIFSGKLVDTMSKSCDAN